jgi:uncharacterized membrane-anchored protein YhcB (DUF1043 family)
MTFWWWLPLIIIVGVFLLYTIIRIVSKAAIRSYFEVKTEHEEGVKTTIQKEKKEVKSNGKI